ncbi:MAG: HEAT repeat domain-containing protein [Planctomycetota bacterium]
MLKLRIAIVSAALLVACVSGAYWTVFAAEKLAPEDSAFAGFGRPMAPPPSPVASGPGPAAALPAASDVRSVNALLARVRAALDGPDRDWRALCSLSDDAVRFGPAAVDPLSSLADNEAEPLGLRLLAIDMLARIDDASAVPALIGCLDRRFREDVRAAAVRALGANPAARSRTSWLFFDLFTSDEHSSVRACAADMVGRSGDERAMPLLRNALRTDASPTVRLAAAASLGNLLDPDALDTLCESAQGDLDPTVRTACVEAAGNYLDAGLRDFFAAIEKGTDTELVRSAARRQLWRIPADR